MDITWLGRRCFSIRGRDATVLTDPHPEATSRLPKGPAVRAVTLSRIDLALNMPGADDGYPRIIKGPGEYEIANILITGVATPYESRDELDQVVRGKNTIYAIELEGLAVCHLGELQVRLTSEQVEEIGDVGILLVPVGDPNSFRIAMDTISLLEPKLVVPMDYPVENKEDGSWAPALARFLKEMGVKEVESQKRLQATISTLPYETQVAVLESSG